MLFARPTFTTRRMSDPISLCRERDGRAGLFLAVALFEDHLPH
jgi:hypothetical protein